MSDQDFFFDEDEKPAKSQSKNAPAKKPASSTAKSGAGAEQSVTYTIAALIGVAALLLGVIVGILLPIGGATTSTTPSAAVTGGAQQQQQMPGGSGTTQPAPQLTPEQLNSGQLPPGHPSVGATGSAPATSTK